MLNLLIATLFPGSRSALRKKVLRSVLFALLASSTSDLGRSKKRFVDVIRYKVSADQPDKALLKPSYPTDDTHLFYSSHTASRPAYECRENNLFILELSERARCTNALKDKLNVNSGTNAKSQNLENRMQCNKMPAQASLIT